MMFPNVVTDEVSRETGHTYMWFLEPCNAFRNPCDSYGLLQAYICVTIQYSLWLKSSVLPLWTLFSVLKLALFLSLFYAYSHNWCLEPRGFRSELYFKNALRVSYYVIRGSGITAISFVLCSTSPNFCLSNHLGKNCNRKKPSNTSLKSFTLMKERDSRQPWHPAQTYDWHSRYTHVFLYTWFMFSRLARLCPSVRLVTSYTFRVWFRIFARDSWT